MAELIEGLRVDVVRRNLERTRAEIAAASPHGDSVEILAAVKYVPLAELGGAGPGRRCGAG